jgi:hypothetical protein
MALPRGRRDPGRGQSRGQGYGSRPSRQPAQRGGPAGYGGRGNGGSGGGGNNAPILAVIAIGGVAVVVFLILLLTRDKGDREYQVPPVAGRSAPDRQPESSTPRYVPPTPLTEAEKTRIKETVDRLELDFPEARRLKDEGFRAQNSGDREQAQECWKEARDKLHEMIAEAETLFETIGDERVETYYKSYYDIPGNWPKLLAEFQKYIE